MTVSSISDRTSGDPGSFWGHSQRVCTKVRVLFEVIGESIEDSKVKSIARSLIITLSCSHGILIAPVLRMFTKWQPRLFF